MEIHTYYTECSGKFVFFPMNFQCFDTSSSAALGCYWSLKKFASQYEWPYIRIENFEVFLQQYAGEGWVAEDCEKHIFFWTPFKW